MVILLSITTTLLLLRNNQIPLHQSLNFVLSPSNHPRSRIMLFGVIVCIFSLYLASTSAVNISSVSSVASLVLLFDTLSLVILSNSNISSNASIVSGLCPAILSVCSFYHNNSVCKLSSSLYLSCKMSLIMLYQMLQP